MFQSSRALRGRVKVDLPVNLAREVIIPRLPELLSRHPGLELVVSATDRRVDAQREGFDCVLRIGPVGDGSLVGRRLGLMPMMNCASPGYLRKYGVPQRLEDLERHLVVHYASSGAEGTPSFEYPQGEGYREWPMRSVLTVNNVDAYVAGCLAGLGLIQVPKAGRRVTLAEGTLVEVLPELTCAPMPVTLLHTHGRRVPRRVRAVMTWLSEVLAPHIEAFTK
jgi:DNA-binding transcriptional LysR family regulator